MADRYPLVVDSSNYRLQELAEGDSLDLGGSSIKNLTISGVTTVAAGSTAAPSISPTGDSNTGIFFPSADTIAFGEGGVEAVRIDSSGNVGIGTTNPGEKLQVDGNLRLGVSTTANYIAFRGTFADDQSGGYNHTYVGERIYGGGERSELLLFKGNDYETSSGPDRIRLAAAEIRFDTYSSTAVAGSFESVATSGNITNKMTLTAAGNLGIGTTNPGEKLQVDGNLRVGLSTVENYIAFHGTQGDGAIGAGVSEVGYSLYTHSIIGERIYDPTTQRSELLLVKSNDQSSGEGPDRIRLQAGAIVFDTLSVNNNPLSFAGIATVGVRRMEITPGGTVVVGAALSVGGALSKGSGTFDIPHPTVEGKRLIHSFVEGPRADLIYRGTVTLSAGSATVNIDESVGLTAGTWAALCREPQLFLQNNEDWTQVRGSVSAEGVITISAKTSTSTANIDWMVVAERQDKTIKSADWTDENGKAILEPNA